MHIYAEKSNKVCRVVYKPVSTCARQTMAWRSYPIALPVMIKGKLNSIRKPCQEWCIFIA